MSYKVHTTDTAPEAARTVLDGTRKAYGFVPNLIGVMSEAPALAEAYRAVSDLFERTSLTAAERQTVLLATSVANQCEYCVAAHSVIAAMQKVPAGVVEAIRDGKAIDDPRLEALRRFTVSVVETRGHPDAYETRAFFEAGFGPTQVLEVILGVGMKTLSNYTNHVADTPLDDAFRNAAWRHPARSAA